MTHLLRKFVAVLLMYVCPFCAFAQQQYLFASLHRKDGLLSENINAVAQDDQGFLWIATNNGLQRFDNRTFISFYHNDSDTNSIANNMVLWLRKDARQRLWLLMQDNRIGFFNTHTFKFTNVLVRAPQLDLSRLDGRLFTTKTGSVILILSSGGVYTYDEQLKEFNAAANPFTLPTEWKPLWLSFDKRYNSYWIGCDSGLVKYNTAKRLMSYAEHNVEHDEVIDSIGKYASAGTLLFDSHNTFWLQSWPHDKGFTVISYNTKTHTKHEWQKEIGMLNGGIYSEITHITETTDGSVWLMGLNIFARFNSANNKLEYFKANTASEFGLRYNIIHFMYEDNAGNIWLCSDKGLFRINPSAQVFHTYKNKRFGTDTSINADVSGIYETKNGDIITCSWGGGTFAYDKNMNPVKRSFIEQGLSHHDGFTWCIAERNNGDIWRGLQDGSLIIYDAKTNTTKFVTPEIFEGRTVRQIIKDDDDNIWFGTQGGLIIKWDATTNNFSLVQRFNSAVHKLYIDKKKSLWVCLNSEGLYNIDMQTNNINAHYSSTGPQGKKLMALTVNDVVEYNDSLYFVASGGINILNIYSGDITYINPSNPAFTNTVSNLVFDNSGVLWVTSQSGLFSMNMKTKVASDFNESDGIEPEDINVAAAYKLRDGRMLFGRIHDFVVFDPKEVLGVDFKPPDVTISGFKVMSKMLLLDSLMRLQHIELPYNQNTVELQFSTLSFKDAFAIYYKLEGIDKDWTLLLNNSNEALYSYLPPGNYTFQVYSSNSDGIKSKNVTEFKFTIAAPFWNTWWFYSLAALLVFAILYWFDQQRIKRNNVVMNMRTNISDNLHEEINTTLQDINVLSEIANIKTDTQPEQSKAYITEINYKSRNMITAMDDMLWSIDPANDTMNKFIARAKQFAASLSIDNNVIIKTQADKATLDLKPDMQFRHELMLMYKDGLTWLVNELHANKTIVQFNYINRHLQMNMFSEGVRPSSAQTASAQKTLIERAAVIKASVDILIDDNGVAVVMSVKV